MHYGSGQFDWRDDQFFQLLLFYEETIEILTSLMNLTLLMKYEGKAVPLHAIKANCESGFIARFNLKLGIRWNGQPYDPTSLTPQERASAAL